MKNEIPTIASATPVAAPLAHRKGRTRGHVLVVMNRFQGYETKVPEALQRIGYEAQWCDARPGNGFATKVLTRLGLLQHIAPISRANVSRIAATARDFDADTLLLISPENLRAPEMQQLREALPGMRILLYLWDSSGNRHLDQAMIDAADSTFSFDLDDCHSFADLCHLPLFHGHTEFPASSDRQTDPIFDYNFVGTARIRRIKVLSGIIAQAKRADERCFFYLFAPSLLQYVFFRVVAACHGYSGALSRQSLPYTVYLEILSKSACAIDIEQEAQGGLTIRTIEAVFAGRPLATTNANVAHHDFCAHFPVSVFCPNALDINVPRSPNTDMARHFFDKYRIDNWLETIMSDQRARHGHNAHAAPPRCVG